VVGAVVGMVMEQRLRVQCRSWSGSGSPSRVCSVRAGGVASWGELLLRRPVLLPCCAVPGPPVALPCCSGRLARAFAAGYYCSDERELMRECGVYLPR
jgi:hypothetical protein